MLHQPPALLTSSAKPTARLMDTSSQRPREDFCWRSTAAFRAQLRGSPDFIRATLLLILAIISLVAAALLLMSQRDPWLLVLPYSFRFNSQKEYTMSLETSRRRIKEKRAHFLPRFGTQRAHFLPRFGTQRIGER